MAELFNAQRFAEIGAAIYEWLLLNVFVVDNLVQLLVVLVTFGIARMLARRLAPIVETLATQPAFAALAGLLDLVRPLVLATLWLALLWLTIGLSDVGGWPHQLIQIAASLLTAWVVIRLVSQL